MLSSRQKEILIHHLKPLQPSKIGVFGSYAGNENIDLDILVYLDYSKRISLLDLIGVEQELSQELGIKVDLVTEKSLSPKPFTEKEIRIIFE